MRILLPLLTAALVVTGFSEVAARPRPEQDQALGSRQADQLMSLPQIERMVVPRMNGARYIGTEVIDDVHYRLKFMRGSSVIWVDVDARTGAIVNQTGQ